MVYVGGSVCTPTDSVCLSLCTAINDFNLGVLSHALSHVAAAFPINFSQGLASRSSNGDSPLAGGSHSSSEPVPVNVPPGRTLTDHGQRRASHVPTRTLRLACD